MMAQAANQQKQIDEITRAAMFSRFQSATRPTVQQQMGMVSFLIINLMCLSRMSFFIVIMNGLFVWAFS